MGAAMHAPHRVACDVRACAQMLQRVDIFCNYAKIARVRAPVFIMHGEQDSVVPISNGHFLHEHLVRPYPPLWLPDVGHNDMPVRTVLPKVRDFLDWVMDHPPPPQPRTSNSTAAAVSLPEAVSEEGEGGQIAARDGEGEAAAPAAEPPTAGVAAPAAPASSSAISDFTAASANVSAGAETPERAHVRCEGTL